MTGRDAYARLLAEYDGSETARRNSETDLPAPNWPEPLRLAAYHGLAGEIVQTIEPHTEADPAAILVQLLVQVGNIIGRRPRYRVEGHCHYVSEYALIVGETATARKGTSRAQALRLLRTAVPQWVAERTTTGLSSGEGLIWTVRDPITRTEPIRERGEVTGHREVCADRGVDDKRLLVYEPEFGGVLKVMGREGNTLSPVLRAAWDGEGVLRSMVKNAPAQATEAHISLLGHITPDELRRLLDRTEAANGFVNRFLIVAARRSKLLPEGGSLTDAELQPLAQRLATALLVAEQVGEMTRSPAAREQWIAMYGGLTAGRPGLLGAVLSRAEAHVLRLSMIYALLDGCAVMASEHLGAARAVWDYCAASAEYAFGDALGDPVADAILSALREAPNGMTRTDIRDLFGRNYGADRLGRALAQLEALRLASREREPTDGRPRDVWKAMWTTTKTTKPTGERP